VSLFSFSRDLHLISISSRRLLSSKSYKFKSCLSYQVVEVLGLEAQILNSLFVLLNEGVELVNDFLLSDERATLAMESFSGCINDGTRIETTYQAARIGIALWHEDL
jgi:hypothetical protein